MVFVVFTVCGAVSAQEITGTLGAPDATTTVSNKQLPPPDPKFGGVIKEDALQSKPWWAPRVVPPQGAPNVLLIITDDAGFGVPSTFGGVIPTPTMDRIANEGLRYNRVFSTALCSPTRAALITGRNHHSAGFGVISEQSTGFPGYNSIINRDKATIGRILLENGYATSWFGKDHNTPAFAASQIGPFDQWPTGMGFEYFYGFVGGDANQWQPNLFRNTTQIYPFKGKEPGTWNLITAMTDDAIDWMTRMHQIDPSKPLFIKYAPGATHAPHHPTREWVDKIHAMHLFDDGYEKLRERIFENQKRLGVGTLAFNNLSGLGRSGTGTLKVDGEVVQTTELRRTMPMILQWDESFDIGSDTLTGVNDEDYKPPFPLTAKLNKLTIKVDRPKLSPEDIKTLEKAEAEALDGTPLRHVQAGPQ